MKNKIFIAAIILFSQTSLAAPPVIWNPSCTSGIKNLFTNACLVEGGGGASSVSNSDGTLTISPTTGAVVASLALGHANSWTGQQTFGTSAPIFSTMTSGSVLFAGTSGILSQDNASLFWDNTNKLLGIGNSSPAARLDIVNNTAANDVVSIKAASSQSGKLLGFKNSGGSSLAYFDSSSNLINPGSGWAISKRTDLATGLKFDFPNNGDVSIYSGAGITLNLSQPGFLNINGMQSNTSGTKEITLDNSSFSPTSGTGVFNSFWINNTINQTGGANGISRSLYINPVLTAASDYRAIEVSSGKSVFLGSINIGSSSALTNTQLQVKDGHISATQTTAPIATVNANAGTGATCSVSNSTDIAGNISLTTTATSPASGAQCSIAFNKAYNVAPICTVTDTNSNSVLFSVTNGVYFTTTTTTLVINYSNADAVGHANTYAYHCIETQ